MSKRTLDPQSFTFTRAVSLENKDKHPSAANRVSVGHIDGPTGYGSAYTINGRTYSERIHVERYRTNGVTWTLSVSTSQYDALTDSARAQLKALAESVEAEFFYAPTSDEITADYQRDARSAVSSATWALRRDMERSIGYGYSDEYQRAAWSAARAEMQLYMDTWIDGQPIGHNTKNQEG